VPLATRRRHRAMKTPARKGASAHVVPAGVVHREVWARASVDSKCEKTSFRENSSHKPIQIPSFFNKIKKNKVRNPANVKSCLFVKTQVTNQFKFHLFLTK
jgi:hypothetical protein